MLEVPRSGCHAWAFRPPSRRSLADERLTDRIRQLHRQRHGVYGSSRIWADLVLGDGGRIGRKRVERLMRQAGLSGLITKRWRSTTVREGVVFFSFVIDVFSRRVVGWQFASHMCTDIVLDALRMALTRREFNNDRLHETLDDLPPEVLESLAATR